MDWVGFLKELLGAFNQIWAKAHSPRSYAEKREKEFKERESKIHEVSTITDPKKKDQAIRDFLANL